MPIIYSYPLVKTLAAEDTFIITKTYDDESRLETRSVTYDDLRKNIISDSSFIYTQAIASNFWDITHNLNKFPSVQVVDTANTSILGFQINYINKNRLTLSFILPFAGKAYLN